MAELAARVMLVLWHEAPSPAVNKPMASFVAADIATDVTKTQAGVCAAVMTIRDRAEMSGVIAGLRSAAGARRYQGRHIRSNPAAQTLTYTLPPRLCRGVGGN
jgi:hypothetical protein